MRIAARFLLLAIVAVHMTGCHSTQTLHDSPLRVRLAIDAVKEGYYQKTMFTSAQIRVLAGEPDAVVSIKDLDLKLKEANESIELREYNRQHIQHTFTFSMKAFHPDVEPRDTFQACEVWLYWWNNPAVDELPGLIPKRLGTSSVFFIIYGNEVMGCGQLTRN